MEISSCNRVPVLMYHGISDRIYPELCPVHVSVKAFEEQMEWLAKNQYKTISADTLLKSWELGLSLEKRVIITFDDGYHSILQYGEPILSKYGFSATFFLTTDPINQIDYSKSPTILDSVAQGDRPLTWEECNTLIQVGWEPGGHSRSHMDHRYIHPEKLLEEIQGSKNEIKKYTGYEVVHYAYPFGGYNEETIQTLKKLHFKSSFSVHAGLARKESSKYGLHRICIEKTTHLYQFKNMVKTGNKDFMEKLRSSLRDYIYQNNSLKKVFEICINTFKKI